MAKLSDYFPEIKQQSRRPIFNPTPKDETNKEDNDFSVLDALLAGGGRSIENWSQIASEALRPNDMSPSEWEKIKSPLLKETQAAGRAVYDKHNREYEDNSLNYYLNSALQSAPESLAILAASMATGGVAGGALGAGIRGAGTLARSVAPAAEILNGLSNAYRGSKVATALLPSSAESFTANEIGAYLEAQAEGNEAKNRYIEKAKRNGTYVQDKTELEANEIRDNVIRDNMLIIPAFSQLQYNYMLGSGNQFKNPYRGLFKGLSAKGLLGGLGALGLMAGTEGAEEMAQEVASAHELSEPVDPKALRDAGITGALMGLGIGGAGHIIGNVTKTPGQRDAEWYERNRDRTEDVKKKLDSSFKSIRAQDDYNQFRYDQQVDARRSETARQAYNDARKDIGIDNFMRAISGQESGSEEGDYSAVNGRTNATGRFQIMPENWSSWAQDAGLSPDAPMTPENQDIVARNKMQEYYNKFGNWRDVAIAWYAGEREVTSPRFDHDAPQGNGDEPSVNEYADSVMRRFNRLGGEESTNRQPRNGNIFGVENYDMPRAQMESSVADLKPGWGEALPQIGGVLKSMGYDPVLTSAARTSEHQQRVNPDAPNSFHIIRENGGDAVDISLSEQELSPDEEQKILDYFKGTGLFDEVLYHSVVGGKHLHLGGLHTEKLAQNDTTVQARADELFNERYDTSDIEKPKKRGADTGEWTQTKQEEQVYRTFAQDKLDDARKTDNKEEFNFLSNMFDKNGDFIASVENEMALRRRYADEFLDTSLFGEISADKNQEPITNQQAQARPQQQDQPEPQRYGRNPNFINEPVIESARKFLNDINTGKVTVDHEDELRLRAADKAGDVNTIKGILAKYGITFSSQEQNQQQKQSTVDNQILNLANTNLGPKSKSALNKKVGAAITEVAKANGITIPNEDYFSLKTGKKSTIGKWQTTLRQKGIFRNQPQATPESQQAIPEQPTPPPQKDSATRLQEQDQAEWEDIKKQYDDKGWAQTRTRVDDIVAKREEIEKARQELKDLLSKLTKKTDEPTKKENLRKYFFQKYPLAADLVNRMWSKTREDVDTSDAELFAFRKAIARATGKESQEAFLADLQKDLEQITRQKESEQPTAKALPPASNQDIDWEGKYPLTTELLDRMAEEDGKGIETLGNREREILIRVESQLPKNYSLEDLANALEPQLEQFRVKRIKINPEANVVQPEPRRRLADLADLANPEAKEERQQRDKAISDLLKSIADDVENWKWQRKQQKGLDELKARQEEARQTRERTRANAPIERLRNDLGFSEKDETARQKISYILSKPSTDKTKRVKQGKAILEFLNEPNLQIVYNKVKDTQGLITSLREGSGKGIITAQNILKENAPISSTIYDIEQSELQDKKQSEQNEALEKYLDLALSKPSDDKNSRIKQGNAILQLLQIPDFQGADNKIKGFAGLKKGLENGSTKAIRKAQKIINENSTGDVLEYQSNKLERDSLADERQFRDELLEDKMWRQGDLDYAFDLAEREKDRRADKVRSIQADELARQAREDYLEKIKKRSQQATEDALVGLGKTIQERKPYFQTRDDREALADELQLQDELDETKIIAEQERLFDEESENVRKDKADKQHQWQLNRTKENDEKALDLALGKISEDKRDRKKQGEAILRLLKRDEWKEENAQISNQNGLKKALAGGSKKAIEIAQNIFQISNKTAEQETFADELQFEDELLEDKMWRQGDLDYLFDKQEKLEQEKQSEEKQSEEKQSEEKQSEEPQISLSTLSKYVEDINEDIYSDKNKEFCEDVLRELAPKENVRDNYTANGFLKASAAVKIYRAISKQAYGNEYAVNLKDLDDSPTPRTDFDRRFFSAAPKIASIQSKMRSGALHEYDLSPVINAVQRTGDTEVQLTSDEAKDFYSLIADSKTPIDKFLNNVADIISEQGNPNQQWLFGENASLKGIVKTALSEKARSQKLKSDYETMPKEKEVLTDEEIKEILSKASTYTDYAALPINERLKNTLYKRFPDLKPAVDSFIDHANFKYPKVEMGRENLLYLLKADPSGANADRIFKRMAEQLFDMWVERVKRQDLHYNERIFEAYDRAYEKLKGAFEKGKINAQEFYERVGKIFYPSYFNKYMKKSSAQKNLQNLSDVKNFDELEDYFREKHNAFVDPELKEKCDFSAVKEFLQGVETVLKDFPQLIRRINALICTKYASYVAAFANGTGKFHSEISLLLPQRYFGKGNVKSHRAKVAKEMESPSPRWTVGANSYKTAGVHEIAHMLDNLLNFKIGATEGSLRSPYQISKDFVEWAYETIQEDVNNKSVEDLASEISKYAFDGGVKKRKTGEIVAEAINDFYYNKEKANPLSKAIFNSLKKGFETDAWLEHEILTREPHDLSFLGTFDGGLTTGTALKWYLRKKSEGYSHSELRYKVIDLLNDRALSFELRLREYSDNPAKFEEMLRKHIPDEKIMASTDEWTNERIREVAKIMDVANGLNQLGVKVKDGKISYPFENAEGAHESVVNFLRSIENPDLKLSKKGTSVDTTIANFVDQNDLTSAQKLLQDFGRKLGTRVIFFKGDKRFHGQHSNGITYLNVDSNMPLGKVFWHETMHWLKANNPSLYKSLVKAAGITDKQRQEYLDRTERNDLWTDEEIDEELISDTFEDVAKRTGMLQSVAGKNRGLIQRVIQWLKDTMNKFIEYFHNPQGKLTTAQAKALSDEFGKIANGLTDANGENLFRYNRRTGNIELSDGRNLNAIQSRHSENQGAFNFSERPRIAFRTENELAFSTQGTPRQTLTGQAGSGSTQVSNTISTYKTTINHLLKAKDNIATVLDYGAGKGLGAKAMREIIPNATVETLEPFPSGWTPNYTVNTQIKSHYDAITNLNVLNVVEPELRDNMVRDIGTLLNVGGKAIIGTRGWKGDIDRTTSGEPAEENHAVWVIKSKGSKTFRVYQKGFDGNELLDYVSDLLGKDFNVKKISGICKNAVMITRVADTTNNNPTPTNDDKIKYSIGAGNNSNQSFAQKIKAKFADFVADKPNLRRDVRITDNLSAAIGYRIKYGSTSGKDPVNVDHKQKVIWCKRGYDYENLLPEVGKQVARNLKISDSDEMGNYIADWLVTGAINNTSAEAREFERALNNDPAMRDILGKVREEFRDRAALTPEERYKEKIHDVPQKSLWDMITHPKRTAKEIKKDWREQVTDDLAPIDRMVEEWVKVATPKMKTLIKESVNPYEMARLLRGKGGVADLMTGDIALLNNRNVKKHIDKIRVALGKAMPNINFSNFKPIAMTLDEIGALDNKETLENLEAFCVAKLDKEMYEKMRDNPDKYGNLKPLQSEADADATISKYEQQLGQAQRDLVNYSNTLLAIMYDSGLMTKNKYYAIYGKWKNYIPTARVFDENEDYSFVDSLSHEKTGSERDIWSPIQKLIGNTHSFVKQAERNKVKLEIASWVRCGGFGKIIAITDNQSPNVGDKIVFYENGQRHYLETPDISIARAINAVQNQSDSAWVAKGLKAAYGMMRGAYTVSNPNFSVGNIFRDFFAGYVHNKHYGLNPANMISNFLNTWQIGAGFVFNDKSLDQDFFDFLAHGGTQASFVSEDTDYAGRSAYTLGKERRGYFSRALDGLQKIAEYSEYATRDKNYKVAKEGLAKKRADGKATIDDERHAALVARNATIDFSKAGRSTRLINKYLLFFNPAVQDIALQGTTFDPRGKTKEEFFSNCFRLFMSSVGLSVVSFALMHDDDDNKKAYKNLNAYEKETYWFLGEHAKFPKSMDIGIRLFSMLTDEALKYAWDKEPVDTRRFLRFLGDASPGFTATIATPIVETWANYSFFRDAPIDPTKENDLSPKYHYGKNTSLVARNLAELADNLSVEISPRDIDHLIEGYLGTFGAGLLKIPDYVLGDKTSHVGDLPVLRRFYHNPTKNPKVVQDYYRELDKQSALYNDYKKGFSKERDAKLDTTLYKRLESTRKKLYALSQREAAIYNDKKMDNAEKDKRLDELQKRRIELCEKALGEAR